MTRVLHVISQLGMGGAGRVALDLVRHGPDHGIQPHLCVLYGPEEAADGAPSGQLSFLGGRPGFKSPGNLLALGRGLRRLVRDFRPDIVHSHLRPADLVVAGALAGAPALHVSHQHDTTASFASNAWRSRLKRRLARSLYRRMGTRFIFVAHAVEGYFSEAFGKWDYHSRVIHNGVDEALLFMEAPPGRDAPHAFVFGTAARLAPEKGIDTLLQAFALLRARWSGRTRLLIAGTGRCENELRSLAAELGVQDSIDFLGRVDDMRAFYNSIDAFVLSSRHSEGFPLTIVEAMACGRPVIATHVAGAPEAVVEGRNGFLVPPDDPFRLAQAMEGMARSDALATLARNAESDARSRFSLRTAMGRIADFYHTALQADRSHGQRRPVGRPDELTLMLADRAKARRDQPAIGPMS